MPKRAIIATRDYLKGVPLPQHATSYTVITHETVIVNVLEQLKLRGFVVKDEKYRANNSGEVATGRYYLEYGNDPDLGMMFAWANSYDKSMRFKCSVGGFVRESGSSIISSDFNWGRKHTGTADQEMISQVSGQIMNGQFYYEQIVEVKGRMKEMLVSQDDISHFLGKAFFMKSLFTKEQIGIVRDEMQKPSFSYNADPNSLWTYYNHMLVALKKAHPRTWMDEQLDLHKYFCESFGLVTGGNPIITPQEAMEKIAEAAVEVIKLPEEIPSPLEILTEDISTKKLNGFNNGRDTTDGVGGKEPPSLNLGGDSEISAEEQARIDEAIKNMEKIKVTPPSLTLPD